MKIKEYIINKEYEEEALEEWKDLTLEKKLYVSYLFSTKKKYTNINNSHLLYAIGIASEKPVGYAKRSGGAGLCDLDIDFCPRGRKDVMQYVAQKYGPEKVSQIGTYAAFKPRGSLRDFARVCGYEPIVGDELAKLIPPDVAGKPLTFDGAIEAEPKLLSSKYPEVVDLARRAEGLRTKAGVHAAGVVIADQPLMDIVPLFRGRGDEVATQFDMHDVEEIGLVKYDFLGLINLTIIHDTLEYIKKYQGIDVSLEEIPENDPEVFKTIFQKGNLDGIFQFETSAGFRNLCVKVRPESILDLSAITALFRPGPLCLSGDSEILTAIQVTKKGIKQYYHKRLKEIYEEYMRKTDKEKKQFPYWAISINEKTLQYEKNKIKNVYRSGTKGVYSIQVKTAIKGVEKSITGKIRKNEGIRSSLDHMFLTLTGWKRLRDLKIGDYLCLVNKTSAGGKKPWAKIPGKKNFQNIALYNYQYRCAMCDWDEGTLDVNHINGNREENNKPENLSFLCPNHHRKYSEGSLKKDELIQERDKYRLPRTESFSWVRYEGKEYLGEEETYDMEMEAPNHNFIANDFVVHNSTGLVDTYAAGRNGTSPEYLTPELEPILKETYGVMVYQEQIMQICVDLAGYTASQADDMRKAIGKKDAGKMATHREMFISGCAKNGITEDISSRLFADIEGFSKYSFNKAHSVAYSIISYTTAWLKTYYMKEFYCSLLNNTIKEQDQLVKYIYSCKENNIPLQPPDVNRSGPLFTLDNGTIVFGLAGIKGVGEKACEALLEKRPEQGFSSLQELIGVGINQNIVRALAQCGALEDVTDLSRGQLVESLDSIVQYQKKHTTWNERRIRYEEREAERKACLDAGKTPPRKLPKLPDPPVPPEFGSAKDLSRKERLALERATLGFYLTGHPLDDYPSLTRVSKYTVEEIIDSGTKGNIVTFPAVISAIERRRTRKGKDMANMIVEDKTARIEVTLFPLVWGRVKDLIQENQVVIVSCKVDAGLSRDDDEKSVVRLLLEDLKIVDEDMAQELPDISEVKIILNDGSEVLFVPGENVEYEAWQQAMAISQNLETR